MTTLSANKARQYEAGIEPVFNDVPVIASDIIYEGAAVGESASTGNARPFTDGDNFIGFAVAKADNSASGAAIGDVNVRVIQKGNIVLPLASITDDDFNAPVYATDDDTFSITDTGSDTQIGKLIRFISTSSAVVYFEALSLRSI